MREPGRVDPDRAERVRRHLLTICLVMLALALVLDFALTRQQMLARGLIWVAALATAGALLVIVLRRRAEQSRQNEDGRRSTGRGAGESQSAIVSELAHALRTPLTAIQGFSELLTTREASERTRQEWLNVLGIEAQRMQAVLERAQDLVRLRDGKVRLKREQVYVHSWVSHVVGLHHELGELRYSSDPASSEMLVTIDQSRFRQTLLLLIEILRSEQPEGTILIHLSPACATPATPHFGTANCPGGASLKITLEKNDATVSGYSIHRPNLHLVEAFSNGDVSLGGIDLGIAREVLALHGASLWIPDDGSGGFGICIPIASQKFNDQGEQE